MKRTRILTNHISTYRNMQSLLLQKPCKQRSSKTEFSDFFIVLRTPGPRSVSLINSKILSFLCISPTVDLPMPTFRAMVGWLSPLSKISRMRNLSFIDNVECLRGGAILSANAR